MASHTRLVFQPDSGAEYALAVEEGINSGMDNEFQLDDADNTFSCILHMILSEAYHIGYGPVLYKTRGKNLFLFSFCLSY